MRAPRPATAQKATHETGIWLSEGGRALSCRAACGFLAPMWKANAPSVSQHAAFQTKVAGGQAQSLSLTHSKKRGEGGRASKRVAVLGEEAVPCWKQDDGRQMTDGRPTGRIRSASFVHHGCGGWVGACLGRRGHLESRGENGTGRSASPNGLARRRSLQRGCGRQNGCCCLPALCLVPCALCPGPFWLACAIPSAGAKGRDASLVSVEGQRTNAAFLANKNTPALPCCNRAARCCATVAATCKMAWYTAAQSCASQGWGSGGCLRVSGCLVLFGWRWRLETQTETDVEMETEVGTWSLELGVGAVVVLVVVRGPRLHVVGRSHCNPPQ